MDDWRQEYQKRIPRTDREIPIGVTGWKFERLNKPQPSSELEAMMMTVPGEEPVPYQEDVMLDPYESVFTQLGVNIELNETQRAVLDARIMSRLTFRAISDMLDIPVTTVHRIFQETMNEIKGGLDA